MSGAFSAGAAGAFAAIGSATGGEPETAFARAAFSASAARASLRCLILSSFVTHWCNVLLVEIAPVRARLRSSRGRRVLLASRIVLFDKKCSLMHWHAIIASSVPAGS
jgi:hypothetical protein